MAAEASTTGLSVSSCHKVGSKSAQGASGCQCTQCGRKVSVASGEEPGGLLGVPVGVKNCSSDLKKTMDQLIVDLEHSSSINRTVSSLSAVMSETEEIDEALKIAGCNFEQLSYAVQMLDGTQNQTREETHSLTEVVEKEFDKLLASLNSRKKSLCQELERRTDDYLSKLATVKSYIEEKKNDLDAAMKIAKELKSAPSLRTYCDLTQIIRTLKLTYESELSQVNSIIPRNSPRLNINCSEIICMFNSMGKIEFEDSTECYPQENEVGQNVQKQSNNKEELGCGAFSSLEKERVGAAVLAGEAPVPPLQAETPDKQLEGKSKQPQKEVAVVMSPKTIAVLPQLGSSPDVIIEEIIEENLESCFKDDPMESPGYQKMPAQKESSAPVEPKTGGPELVFVSHIIHPCHFYVRKYSQIKDATMLEKKMKQVCNKSLHLDPSDILELGARIFVNSIENRMWCRGIITEIIPTKTKNIRKPCSPTKFSVCEISVIQIFMVDFGNSEVLIITGVGDTHMRPEHVGKQRITLSEFCLLLRKSEPYSEELLKDTLPLAHLCSLKDIVPYNSSEGWEKEAKVEFLKMVNNKAVLMKIFGEEDDVLIVDLQKPPTNKISSDMPVSLRDALVFMELARFRSQSPRSHSEKNTTLCYHPPILPEETTEVSVMVCHINSPTDFYLQLMENLDFLSLLKTIEEFYKGEDGENLEILCPVQDQACVAKFEDGIWYRAKVIGLPGRREVEVKYVDFGNTAKITLKDMRKIKDEFLDPPPREGFIGNPRQLTSEPWVLTKLWSWHPSDHPPKSPHTRASETDKGGTEYLGPPAHKEMLAPLEELTDSLPLFQDPSTSRESNPEPAELGVSHQHLTNKLIPPGKQPENILMPNVDQIQAPILRSQFKSTASLAEAPDHQLDAILVPPLDSQRSKATTFMVSPKELKKDLTQHRKLAKVVDGKPQFHKQTKDDDYYGDLNMNEGYSNSLPLQSQENADEAPEFLEQDEPDQLETQVQNTENLHQEAPDYFPQEDEPLMQREDSAHHQLPSEEPSVHPEIRGPPPNRNEAQHSNLPNVTVNPVASEADKEVQATLGQQQTLAQFPESSELMEPSSTQQEDPAQILELPENLENSGIQLEVPALPPKLPEEISPLVEQGGTVPVPESSMQGIAEAPAATIPYPTQHQAHHDTLPMFTVKPPDVALTITSEPFKEVELTPAQEETPTQTTGPLVQAAHYPNLEQHPDELSESPAEIESSESGQEFPIQLPEEAEEEEEEASLIQQNLLEDESSIELEQPAQPSEPLEEVGSGPGSQPEVLVTPTELPEEAMPPTEQAPPLQVVENVVETPSIHQVTFQPTQSEEHHYHLPHVVFRPVDVALTITSEPTKEMESSLTQQESPVHTLECPGEEEPFFSEQEQPAEPSELEIPTQSSEHALTQQEQATLSSEHHEVTVSSTTHHQTHHSSLSSLRVQPPDMQLTITQEPTTEVGPPPVHHEAIVKPKRVQEKDVGTSTTQYTNPAVTPEPSEGIKPLSNHQESPVQSPEPVQYENHSLNQHGGTDENPELPEELELSSAQQQNPVQTQELPHETVVQPPEHQEAAAFGPGTHYKFRAYQRESAIYNHKDEYNSSS
ncbi:RING finger protein 17 [Microtus ochrogaster]|uniref:RING finger protein 17 n=1 Tax=Microtus ochrogaster TaxID=79684 RepID=A0A8J6KKM2_MICOH|nr:RING finger protein 17 [Microtus ochrogaster]